MIVPQGLEIGEKLVVILGKVMVNDCPARLETPPGARNWRKANVRM